MPAFARLLAEGAQHPITEDRGGSFTAERWTSMVTGVGPEVHRYWSWAERDPVTCRDRPAPLDAANTDRVWDVLSGAGQRVAVLDVPRQPLSEIEGIQLCEWGTHDRDLGTRSWPPGLARELDERFGPPAANAATRDQKGQFAPCDVLMRDGHGTRTTEQLRALAALVREGLESKARASEHLLGSGEWDLFFTVFGESHCATHQFWHLHEPRDDRDRDQAEVVGNVVAETFEGLDAALARHVELAGPEAAVVAVLHSGMRTPHGGNEAIDEVVTRLAGRTRPFSACTYTSQIGAIRLNLAGRDLGGTLTEESAPETVRRLAAELLLLADADTGRPAVRAVRSRAELFGDLEDDALPDLFVEWAGDAAIRTLTSPTIGEVTGRPRTARTGDHKPDGLVVVSGPGTEAGARATFNPVELAPLLAGMLGVDYPTGAPTASNAARSSS